MKLLADCIWWLHSLVNVVAIAIIFYRAGEWLKYACLGIMLMIMHWHIPLRNAPGKCFLTCLEHKVRTGRVCDATATSWSFEHEISHLARSVGIKGNINYDDLAHISWGLLGIIALVRYCNYKKSPVRLTGATGFIIAVLVGLWAINIMWKPR